MNPRPPTSSRSNTELWLRLALTLGGSGALPDRDTPIGALTHDFFANNWAGAQPWLARTRCLRVSPQPSPTPHAFGFEIDRPYKRLCRAGATVELAPGPIRGVLCYRTDPFSGDSSSLSAVVYIERELGFFHPNHSRQLGGLLCLGDLPAEPLPLDQLFEHVYRIASYQNLSTSSALDPHAARYFAEDPHALDGLVPVEPMY